MTAQLVAEVEPMDTDELDAQIFECAGCIGEGTCVDGRGSIFDTEISGRHDGGEAEGIPESLGR